MKNYVNNRQALEEFEELRDYLQILNKPAFARKIGKSFNGVKFNKRLKTIISGKSHFVSNDEPD